MGRHGADEWGVSHGSGIWMSGRIVLNLWRIMRSEAKLGIYTFENVVHHVLKRRIPHFTRQVWCGVVWGGVAVM